MGAYILSDVEPSPGQDEPESVNSAGQVQEAWNRSAARPRHQDAKKQHVQARTQAFARTHRI